MDAKRMLTSCSGFVLEFFLNSGTYRVLGISSKKGVTILPYSWFLAPGARPGGPKRLKMHHMGFLHGILFVS